MLGSTLLVDSVSLIDRGKQGLDRGEVERFPVAKAQKATMTQTLGKLLQHLILQRPIEINEHVAAADQVHLAEDAVGHQVVIGKRDALLQEILYFRSEE